MMEFKRNFLAMKDHETFTHERRALGKLSHKDNSNLD